MKPFSGDEAHEAAIKAAVKEFKPYRPVKRSEMDPELHGWMVVYFPPVGKRVLVIDRFRTRKKAKRYADLLCTAWAEGRSIIGLM
jgi:hypothetical protein